MWLPGWTTVQLSQSWKWALVLPWHWSLLKLFPAQPGEQWFPAAISIRKGIPSQWDLKSSFQSLCHHSTVLEMQRWMTAKRARTWKLLNWGNTWIFVWSTSELPVTQQSLHLSGWSYDLSNSGQFGLTDFWVCHWEMLKGKQGGSSGVIQVAKGIWGLSCKIHLNRYILF